MQLLREEVPIHTLSRELSLPIYPLDSFHGWQVSKARDWIPKDQEADCFSQTHPTISSSLHHSAS